MHYAEFAEDEVGPRPPKSETRRCYQQELTVPERRLVSRDQRIRTVKVEGDRSQSGQASKGECRRP